MGYKMFGPQVDTTDGTIRWVEWAPAASGLNLIGDFNQWSKPGLQFRKLEFGRWELVVGPGADGQPVIKNGDKVGCSKHSAQVSSYQEDVLLLAKLSSKSSI